MREKFYRFMQGRYGVDDLYRFLVCLALLGMVLNWLFKKSVAELCGNIDPGICRVPRAVQKSQCPLRGEPEISACHGKIPLLV